MTEPRTKAGRELLGYRWFATDPAAPMILDAILAIEAEARSSHSDVSADLRAALDATEEPSDDVAPGWETDRAYIWRSGWDARGVALARLAAPSAGEPR